MRFISLLVLVWLIIGAIAAGQHGYFTHATDSCSSLGTIAVTTVAGPLNYMGLNPKVVSCHMPQPSQ